MKYIVFETKGFTFPVIFPDVVNHCDIIAVTGGDQYTVLKPTSAGFFGINSPPLEVTCFGESESLGLKPILPRDNNLIYFAIQNRGSYAFDNNLKMFDK